MRVFCQGIMSRYITSLEFPSIAVDTISELQPNNGLHIQSMFCDGRIMPKGDSAAAPPLAFSGSTSTGVYYSAPYVLGISVDGASKMRLGESLVELDSTITGFTVSSLTQSTNSSSGAVVVTGGCGISGNLNVGGTFSYLGSLNAWGYTVSDGTAALPTFTFATDLNTGIYRIGASQLGFSTGGTLRLTLSPTAAAIASSVTTTTFLASTVSSNTTTGALVTSGGVGIAGNLGISGTLNYSGSITYSSIAMDPQTYASYGFTSSPGSGLGYNTSDNSLVLIDNYQSGQYYTAMRIKPSVNSVYVGYTSSAIDSEVTWVGRSNTYTMSVGSTTVGYPSCNSGSYATCVGSYNTLAATHSVCIGYGAGAATRSVAIGPFAQATYSDSVAIGWGASSSGTGEACIGDSSWAVLRGSMSAGTWYSSSDERLKSDITPITNALPFVMQLKPCKYKWLDGRNDDEWHGFTYQRIVATLVQCGIDPADFDAVNKPTEDAKGSVAMAALIPYVVAAMKELSGIVSNQNTAVSA